MKTFTKVTEGHGFVELDFEGSRFVPSSGQRMDVQDLVPSEASATRDISAYTAIGPVGTWKTTVEFTPDE